MMELQLQDFAQYVEPNQQPTLTSDQSDRRVQSQVGITLEIFELLRNADLLVKANDFSLALHLLRKATNSDSKNPIILSRLGCTLEACSKWEEALRVWVQLLKIQYGFESSFRYAQCLYHLGRYEEALQAYFDCMSVVTESREELFEVYKNVGNIFLKQADIEGAEEYFNKAYSVQPNSDVLLVNIGTLEFQRQDLEKSQFAFRRAIELNAANDKAWVGLALVHQKMGDIELSIANLEKAIDLNPMNRTAILLFASWARNSAEKARATEHMQSYLCDDGGDVELSLLLMQSLCEIHQQRNAEIELTRAHLFTPKHAELMRLKQQVDHAARETAC